MNKIGIITLNGYKNFGNRLQNYALTKCISKYGIKTENIWKINRVNKFKNIIKSVSPLKKHRRFKNFYTFNKKIKTKYTSDYDKIKTKYKKIVVGSDQVWNPYFASQKNYFLDFSIKEKNIAYAASIGVDEIPKNKIEYFKNGLNNIDKISVREEVGKKIVEDLTGRNDVEVLIDPTMLLTSEEWDKVSKKPRQLKNIKEGKYILNYFLGELSESRKKEIERIAKENNCHIINILYKEDPFYTCGPSEFLYLEKHASLICTDSFHSCVFSLLFNRPFIIFDREEHNMDNMNSRTDTLLSKFKLRDRRFNGKNITKENLNHDYTEAYKILDKERKKSEEFLKKALDIE